MVLAERCTSRKIEGKRTWVCQLSADHEGVHRSLTGHRSWVRKDPVPTRPYTTLALTILSHYVSDDDTITDEARLLTGILATQLELIDLINEVIVRLEEGVPPLTIEERRKSLETFAERT